MNGRHLTKVIGTIIGLILFLTLAGCGGSSGKGNGGSNTNPDDPLSGNNPPPVKIDEKAVSAVISGGKVVFDIPLTSKSKAKAAGVIKVRLDELINPDKKGKEEIIPFNFSGGKGSVKAEVPIEKGSSFAPGDTAKYVANMSVVMTNYNPFTHKRSLFDAVRISEAVILSTDKLQSDGQTYIRAMVKDPKTGTPVAGAKVTAVVATPELEGGIPSIETKGFGITDDFGIATVLIKVGKEMSGMATMSIAVETDTESQYVEKPVTIVREQKILLTTDKPMYQPGQTMHLRALSLRQASLKPDASVDCLFEIMDAKGNKVFKQSGKTNDYGIASVKFKLAREVNEGAFTIKAIVGDTAVEKTVTVEKYKLPKFKVELTSDKQFYKPKDTLTAYIKAYYFFGKSVSGGTYDIEFQKFEGTMTTFTVKSGTLDENGTATVKVELPSKFYGDEMHGGHGFVAVLLKVTDTAGQVIELSREYIVSESTLVPFMFADSASIAPNLPNKFVVLTSNPIGQPVEADVTLDYTGGTKAVKTDKFGVGIVEIIPESSSLQVTMTAKAANGDSAKETFKFTADGNVQDAVRIRTDKAYYKVGETIDLQFFATGGRTGVIFFDIIKSGQTMFTNMFHLDKGRGEGVQDISADMTGTLQLFAYYISEGGSIIRDTKLIQVEDANDLYISVKTDKDIYRPAEEAKINFEITDKNASPVQAALGIHIVDEAVYALQENKPGLEKIFFQLEEELLTPRYQIYGFSKESLLDDDPSDPEARDRAAEVLLAAAEADANYGIQENTYTTAVKASVSHVTQRVQADFDKIKETLTALAKLGIITVDNYKKWFKENSKEYTDPFGNPYVLSVNCRYGKDSNCYSVWDYDLQIHCIGADELENTADDIKLTTPLWEIEINRGKGGSDEMADGGGDWNGDDDDFAWDDDDDWDDGDPSSGGGGELPPGQEEADMPRVRRHFPETLYVNPALITDEQGKAQISVPMADSITSWRMTTMANSMRGQLGSSATGITVFQDFFVDIDFPVFLTQGDEVSVPVIVYNYLKVPQSVTLNVVEENWFQMLDASSKTIPLEPNQVTSLYFKVKVNKVGFHTFTVFGMGTEQSDAVARSVEVVPNGSPVAAVFSGVLKGDVEHTIEFPSEAIEDASKLQIKIYPGMVSQAVEGLDSILKMPGGCFEQTSSSSYPNILVLDYLREAGVTSPAIEAKALDYIAQGYQRLLTFEVKESGNDKSGGFEWFGQAPAHTILTAYGLLQFSDMNRVYEVDPALITRIQNWLSSKQNGDGSWQPQKGGILEGAINNFTGSALRNTAYVTWALAESGYKGAGLEKGINFIKTNINSAEDNYTLALIANALVSHDKSSGAAKEALDKLIARKKSDGDKTYWEQEEATESYSYGNSAVLETTALAAYALVKHGGYFAEAQGVINYLIGSKDQFGNWSNTQATIYSLKAMIASLGNKTQPANADVKVYVNGQMIKEWTITTENSEVMRQLDLIESELSQTNEVKLTISGEGTFMYQVVGTHYLPWGGSGETPQGPLSIDVAYDKTSLEVDEAVKVTVTVTNNYPDYTPGMVIVDLGVPPGFEVMAEDLNKVVAEEALVTRYELTGRQIIVYLVDVPYGLPLSFSYHLRAKFPVNAQTPSSEVYPYYTPEDGSSSEPTPIFVSGN